MFCFVMLMLYCLVFGWCLVWLVIGFVWCGFVVFCFVSFRIHSSFFFSGSLMFPCVSYCAVATVCSRRTTTGCYLLPFVYAKLITASYCHETCYKWILRYLCERLVPDAGMERVLVRGVLLCFFWGGTRGGSMKLWRRNYSTYM